MIPLDMTAQLAPILWGIETLLLVSVVWLVTTYVVQEAQRQRLRNRCVPSIASNPRPPEPEETEDLAA